MKFGLNYESDDFPGGGDGELKPEGKKKFITKEEEPEQ